MTEIISKEKNYINCVIKIEEVFNKFYKNSIKKESILMKDLNDFYMNVHRPIQEFMENFKYDLVTESFSYIEKEEKEPFDQQIRSLEEQIEFVDKAHKKIKLNNDFTIEEEI